MAVSEGEVSPSGHVNMLTDLVINNLPPDGLRTVMRSLLSANPIMVKPFERETKAYLRKIVNIKQSTLSTATDLETTQKAVRCMIGCGTCIESLPVLSALVCRTSDVEGMVDGTHPAFLASLDGDIVLAMTAVQKLFFDSTGSRGLIDDEKDAVQQLGDTLTRLWGVSSSSGETFAFGRGFSAVSNVLGWEDSPTDGKVAKGEHHRPSPASETFQLGSSRAVPRVFSGLWQLSSPSWGSAGVDTILSQFSTYAQHGLTAWDMADHYGDAELLFGRFLQGYPFANEVFTATKYCVFHPMTVSREAVSANVSERCRRLQQAKIDLLQFHWQFYDDDHYIDALRFIHEDERVIDVGLCNFDTKHMQHVIDSGIPIVSNQVQFSLIDSRPVVAMGAVCQKHNVKLLTYGTLCGGFLAEKWLDKPDPDIYDTSSTPSQRKYYEMIRTWGGWDLFQELLRTLERIASKHGVTVSNVAVRWVLDFSYVGAVIVGARMGVSEHITENLASLGWSLDDQDYEAIEYVQRRSRRERMFETIGDCGAEYRQ